MLEYPDVEERRPALERLKGVENAVYLEVGDARARVRVRRRGSRAQRRRRRRRPCTSCASSSTPRCARALKSGAPLTSRRRPRALSSRARRARRVAQVARRRSRVSRSHRHDACRARARTRYNRAGLRGNSGTALECEAGSMSSNYRAADIEVLSGLEPVRRRPGMYTDTTRPNHLAHEVVDNSVDEAVAGHAKKIDVVLLRRRLAASRRRRPRHARRHPSAGEAAPASS